QVSDTGIGIPTTDLETIFDAFVQAQIVNRSQRGTGLGLAISRQFVRLLGGDITVHSEVNRGSTFVFDIPLVLTHKARHSAPTSQHRVVALAPGQPEFRILVVDDQPDNRAVLCQLLTQVGFDVREAENGQAAIALYKIYQPHLIWMDMRMPVMDGYEATRQIRTLQNSPPHPPRPSTIIALTASVFEEKREAVLAAGCDDFVRKPYQYATIFEKLTEYLGAQFIHNDRPSADPPSVAPLVSDDDLLTGQPISAFLQVLSPKWIQQLQDAAIQADSNELYRLIQQVPEEQGAITQALTQWVQQFNYDRILAWIEAIQARN
ncbi:MAG: response regulator, partial [Cyanobacteria bacterium J06638_6]